MRSQRNIAGIMIEAGIVMGMMPYPERAMEPILGSTDRLGVFTSLTKVPRLRAPEEHITEPF